MRHTEKVPVVTVRPDGDHYRATLSFPGGVSWFHVCVNQSDAQERVAYWLELIAARDPRIYGITEEAV
jgi:hypothetical protein